MEALISIKQISTIEAYKTQFEMLFNRARGLSNSYKLNCFLGGLKEEIRISVRILPSELSVSIWAGKDAGGKLDNHEKILEA